MPSVIQIVIDTNVFIAALRSTRGASHQIVFGAAQGRWQKNVSTFLILEYEEKAREFGFETYPGRIDAILDQLVQRSNEVILRFRWSASRDPDDDHVVDLTVAANAHYLVTFNTRNFIGARALGIQVVTPGQFLNIV